VCSILLFSLPMFIEDYTLSVKLYLLPYCLPVIHLALGSILQNSILAENFFDAFLLSNFGRFSTQQ
jgi:hypothetical protein